MTEKGEEKPKRKYIEFIQKDVEDRLSIPYIVLHPSAIIILLVLAVVYFGFALPTIIGYIFNPIILSLALIVGFLAKVGGKKTFKAALSLSILWVVIQTGLSIVGCQNIPFVGGIACVGGFIALLTVNFFVVFIPVLAAFILLLYVVNIIKRVVM